VHSFFVKLRESLIESEVEGVRFKKDKKRELEMLQDRGEGKAGFQKIESDLTSS
jgi:hypothetical protein